jgi:hypothetical protein
MAFGSLITDGTQESVGTNGYVVGFDLANLNIVNINQVQLQNAVSLVMSAVDINNTSKATLFAYNQDANAPDFAWSSEGTRVYVFCKTTVYPYTSQTRIAFWYNAQPEELSALSDVVIPNRLPAEARNLLVLLCAKEAQTLSGINPTRDILQQINSELNKLGLV